ncbi:MAG: porin family protein [Flavobacteriaceae bacterium]|nr:porin family protein [Flavobacteriaceae bacterium]
MKRDFILLLFIGINLSLFAQGDTRNLRLGLLYTLDNNLSSERFEVGKYTGYSAEYNKPNYKIGLSIEYLLKNRFSLNSGLNYSNKNFTGTYYCAICYFSAPPNPKTFELQFIEIPVSLRYYFLPNKLKIYADIGLINQFEITNKIIEKKYSISGKLGCGIEYNLNPKLAFQLMTEYNKGLTNMFKKSDFKIKTISFGLGIVKKI